MSLFGLIFDNLLGFYKFFQHNDYKHATIAYTLLANLQFSKPAFEYTCFVIGWPYCDWMLLNKNAVNCLSTLQN